MNVNSRNFEPRQPRPSLSNFLEKYLGWLRLITVEPTMWLYMMAFMVTSVVEQAFFLHKSCRVNHGFSEEVCNNLNANSTIKKQVQITVSDFHQWNNIAEHIVPIILALFFGNWSDRRGRKMPIVVGLIGKLIYSMMIVVNSMIDSWDLNMVIYTASLPMGFLGGDVAIFGGCFAYISDVSSVKQRTFRVTILDVVYLSTMPTGIALGSYLFNSVVSSSYTIMFLINSFLLAMAILYSILRLKAQTTSRQKPLDGANIFLDFFDRKHVAETARTMLKSRPNHGRLYLWILMVAMMLYTFQRDEKPMSYLYTQLRFHWDVKAFSQFRTFQSALFVVAVLVGVPIMSKFLKMSDCIIIAVGACSHALGRVIFALAKIPQLFYAGAAVAALGPVVAAALRSMTSKVVPIQERGKVFAMLAVCDNAVPFFSGILYSQLYNATISTMPNSIYWLTFGTQVAVLLLILVIYFSPDSKYLEEESFIENMERNDSLRAETSTPDSQKNNTI